MNKYEMDYYVDFRDVDRYFDIKPEAMVQFLGTISTFHEIKGMGLKPDYMRQRGLAWVLYQWKYEIYDEKQYARKLRVITVPTTVKDIYCYRYYIIYNQKDEVIARALSHWVAIDLSKRRLTKVPKDLVALIEGSEEETKEIRDLKEHFDIEAPRYKLEEHDFSCEFNLLYQDIDMNQHVNNAVYARWAMEAINKWDNNFLLENYPKFVNIVYKKEKAPNGFVKVKFKSEGEETKFEILDEEDKVLNLIIVKWGKKDKSFGDFTNY